MEQLDDVPSLGSIKSLSLLHTWMYCRMPESYGLPHTYASHMVISPCFAFDKSRMLAINNYYGLIRINNGDIDYFYIRIKAMDDRRLKN